MDIPHEPIKGEQAAMLGVSQKVVIQKRIYKVATASMDDYIKVKRMKQEEQCINE